MSITIQNHQGSVVSSIAAADYCLLSACRPDAMEAAARVIEEGGTAIDASWLWESNAVGRLLPWYPYQLGKDNKHPDMSDEMRDTHELATSLARYLPFASSVDSIYLHLAMRVGNPFLFWAGNSHLSFTCSYLIAGRHSSNSYTNNASRLSMHVSFISQTKSITSPLPLDTSKIPIYT
jgi:hypothetical protein